MISVHFQGKPSNIRVIQLYAPTTNAEETEVERFCEDLQNHLELTTTTTKKDVHFITGGWNAKVGSQEILEIIGKFGLGVQNKAGQRLAEFCQENTLVIANILFQQHKRWLYTWTSRDGQNTEIRFIIFFAAEVGKFLYSQQEQDLDLTVAQIMSSLLQNSDLHRRK